MVEVAGEPRVLQAQGVEMAFDLGEALLHDLAQHHRQAVAEKACQPELQEHRQLEQDDAVRSEEHTSELQSLMRISYAVFCLQTKKHTRVNKPHNKAHHT